MSDLKLFRTGKGDVTEIRSQSIELEKSLQTLIEANLETTLGVRFLASEYATGKTHGGRIDTLGIDENACPVILEYKRALNENVINQGLYYLDWLLDHKAEIVRQSLHIPYYRCRGVRKSLPSALDIHRWSLGPHQHM
jgi:RecB family endonuclease NucS